MSALYSLFCLHSPLDPSLPCTLHSLFARWRRLLRSKANNHFSSSRQISIPSQVSIPHLTGQSNRLGRSSAIDLFEPQISYTVQRIPPHVCPRYIHSSTLQQFTLLVVRESSHSFTRETCPDTPKVQVPGITFWASCSAPLEKRAGHKREQLNVSTCIP